MGGQIPLGELSPIFLEEDISNVITCFKFGDDPFRGLASAEGQILSFPIDFDGRPCNTLTLPFERVMNSKGVVETVSGFIFFPGLCDFSSSTGMVRLQIAGLEMGDRFTHVEVEVRCFNVVVATQRVRVGEKMFTAVFACWFEVLVIEFVCY